MHESHEWVMTHMNEAREFVRCGLNTSYVYIQGGEDA